MADMELDAGAGMEVEVPLESEEADMINQVSPEHSRSHPTPSLTHVATPLASQENSWQVISSFFEAKGLVRQQLVRRLRCVRGAQPRLCSSDLTPTASAGEKRRTRLTSSSRTRCRRLSVRGWLA
jgi:hypothetical protein